MTDFSYAGSSSDQTTTDRPSVDMLARFFETVVFGNELEPSKPSNSLARWKVPIAYRVDGRPATGHLKILRQHIDLISGITHLTISPVSQSRAAENLTILFLTGTQMSDMKFENVPPAITKVIVSHHTCYFLLNRTQPAQISRSFIVVNVDRSMGDIEHCLLEELVQSLGLPNDSDILRPSIFSDADQLRELSRHDEIILRTLYDDRLQDGLGRKDVMVMVREILKDWDSRLP
jgi:hypothetical protein